MDTYRKLIKMLLEQATSFNWELEEACRPENRKLFPFYCDVSLCRYSRSKAISLPKISYEDFSDCSIDDRLYWGFVVWEDKRKIKFYHCLPSHYYHKIYTYREQIYGNPSPILFDPYFNQSIAHRAVWRIVINEDSTVPYMLYSYRNTGISEDFYNSHFKRSWRGSSHWDKEQIGCFEFSSAKGIELSKSFSESPYLTLNHTQILKIINTILKHNADTQQLNLF